MCEIKQLRLLQMKQLTKYFLIFFAGLLLLVSSSSFKARAQTTEYSLTAEVNNLRNADGVVIFALYNREDAFPDELYKKYFKKITGKIVNGSSSVIFENLPPGKYAVNILHDEDNDGKIKKGFFLPKEGIGFSNYQSIGLRNRPNFSKAVFELKENKSIIVKVIYM